MKRIIFYLLAAAYLLPLAALAQNEENLSHEVIPFPAENQSLIRSISCGKRLRIHLINLPHQPIQIALLSNKQGAENALHITDEKSCKLESRGVAFHYDEEGLGQYIVQNIIPPPSGGMYVTVNNPDNSPEETLLIIGRDTADEVSSAGGSTAPYASPHTFGGHKAIVGSSKPQPKPVFHRPSTTGGMLIWITAIILLFLLGGIALIGYLLLRRKSGTSSARKYGYYYELSVTDEKQVRKVSIDLIALERQPMLIGRNDACNLTLSDRLVSSKHCSIHARQGKLFLTDIESKNGTRVNGKIVPPNRAHALHGGDTITLGNSQLKLNKYRS